MTNESIIRQFRCESRVQTANKRFEDKITKKDVLQALKLNDLNCFYCNDKIDYKNWQLDHFNPRFNGGKNEVKNLVACCKWCNTMKNALCGNSFIDKCFQIISNNFFVRNNIDKKLNDKKNTIKFNKIKKVLKNSDISLEQYSKIKEIINTYY